MPELIDKAKVLKYLTPRIKTETPYGEGYNKALEDAAALVTLLPTIEPEERLIPKEVRETDIDKLTEMIKDSLLQAYPNDVMFTAVRHGRWECIGEYEEFSEEMADYLCESCGYVISRLKNQKPKFCEGCGARMGE